MRVAAIPMLAAGIVLILVVMEYTQWDNNNSYVTVQ